MVGALGSVYIHRRQIMVPRRHSMAEDTVPIEVKHGAYAAGGDKQRF